MIVVVRRVGLQHRPQVRFAVDQHPVRAFGPDGPHPALGITIPRGARGGDFTTRTPASAKIASNTALNLASRSRIRNRNEPIQLPKTDPVAQAGQLAVHPPVSPRRVLRRQPQHQVTDLRARPWAAWPSRVGPLAGDQTAVPGQQRSRRDQSAGTERGGQLLGQWRSTRISASFDAWLRPSRTSQPNTRTMIRYSRRADMNRDHAPARRTCQIAAQRPTESYEAVQAR